MSITVAAVQIPYCHSPYRKPTLASHLSGGETSNTSTKGHIHIPLEFRPATPSKNHRWSPNSTSGDCTAEEKQMSSNGTASGLSLHESYHRQSSNSAPPTLPDNVPVTAQFPGRDPKMDGQPGQGSSLPPSYRSPEGTSIGPERRSSRPLGVHSILNPPHAEDGERRARRRSAAQMEEGSGMEPNPLLSGLSLTRPQSRSDIAADETSPPTGLGPRVIRRILTPISPRLHRAASFGHGRIATGAMTGTINAQETPFLSPSSRIHSQEPGTGNIPPLPQHTSQVAQHSPFAVPAAPTPPLPAARRASVSVVHSARASPSPSYASSYGHSGQTSPALPHYPTGSGPTPPGSYHLTPSPVVGPLSNVPPSSLESEQGFGIPVVSSGQNYQLLTIDTTKGHMQLPVEVQAASRMADEKRKRNAGASARFRARRKEKEREASSRIANLEQELAFAQDDSRHYKQERDYLVDIILRNVPHYEGYLRDRPPSPRHNRVRRLSEQGMSSGRGSTPPRGIPGPPPILPVERFERTEGDRPATRRRTETFPLVSPAATTPGHRPYPHSPFPPFTPATAAHPQQQQQQQQPPQPLPQPSQHQTHYAPPTTGAAAPPPLLSRPPASHDQYRPEQAHERSWTPQTGAPR